jgi:cytochrome c biogenesis protein CcdA
MVEFTEFLAIGLLDSVNQCSLYALTLFAGILLLVAVRKDLKKLILPTLLSFSVATVFYAIIIFFIVSSPSLSDTSLEIIFLVLFIISVLATILLLVLGVYGLLNYYRRGRFTIKKYLVSLPCSILFGVLTATFLLPCLSAPLVAAFTIISQAGLSIFENVLYLVGVIVPFIVISVIIYLGSANEKETNKIRYLQLAGSLLMILSVILGSIL